MSITTTHSTTRRLGLASSAAATAALLLLASACGTETAASQAPGSISGPIGLVDRGRSRPPTGRSAWSTRPRTATAASPAHEPTESAEVAQPLYLAPSGRPVPLPGQHG